MKALCPCWDAPVTLDEGHCCMSGEPGGAPVQRTRLVAVCPDCGQTCTLRAVTGGGLALREGCACRPRMVPVPTTVIPDPLAGNVARALIVADHWRRTFLRAPDTTSAPGGRNRLAANTLTCVIDALCGVTDPAALGVAGADADAIRKVSAA